MSALTQQLMSYGGAVTDPYWNNVVALLHGDGTNGSTTFFDSKIAANWADGGGNIEISTAQAKFGTASIWCPLTSGGAATRADSANYRLGSRDFFIEMWVRWPTSVNSTFSVFLAKYRATGTQREFQFRKGNTGLLEFLYSTDGNTGTQVTVTAAWSPAADTWYSIAVGRSGNTLYLFVNGVLINTASMSGVTIFADVASVSLGAIITSGGTFNTQPNCYIDEIRWTMDVCRHTSNYTPQAAASPDS